MTPLEWTTITSTVGAVIFGAVGWSVWAAWWLSKQFSQTRSLIWTKGEELQKHLEAKLEYHELHDDQRFLAVSNDLWALRVRNAERDGVNLAPRSETYKANGK